MGDLRQEKLTELIRQNMAVFIESEATKQSLITVTRVEVSSDSKNATIFISVLPDIESDTALKFLVRKQHNMREYLKKHMRTRIIPRVTVMLDYGEKNRQRIDELLFKEKEM